METDKEALENYQEEGVELPDVEPESPEVEEPEEKPEEEPTDKELETPELSEEPEKPRKRSIYQDYKENKQELKSERELREQAEKERDELRAKLEKQESPNESDEIDAFAKEIGADPNAIRRMKTLFMKDAGKTEFPADLQEQLKQFQEFQAQNSEAVDAMNFEKEFKATKQSLTELFPNISADETELVKEKLNELAHTERYHDKELDYILFKEKEAISGLVSPKKRGLETKGKVEEEQSTFTFNPDADLAKMSPKEAEQWEKEYAKMTQSSDLATDAEGRKIII